MQYEKISLVKDGVLKEYDLIKEMSLDKYQSNYVVFTEDASQDNMDVFIMKVLNDGSLENIFGQELIDCKVEALGGDFNE